MTEREPLPYEQKCKYLHCDNDSEGPYCRSLCMKLERSRKSQVERTKAASEREAGVIYKD